MAQQKNRRNALIAALAVLVVTLAVGGTIAWLTATDELHNEFTVGSIGKPDKEPETDEGGDQDEDESNTSWQGGYLFETEWDKDLPHTLNQGVAEPKNPNVGISAKKTDGATNNEAYVFLYVDNDSLAETVENEEGALAKYAPYFNVEHQWLPVTAESDNTDAGKVAPVSSTAAGSEDAYVSGLFMYAKGASPASPTLPVVLSGANADLDEENVYTGELFEDITIPKDLGEDDGAVALNVTDNYKMGEDANTVSVYAYIYAADGTENEGGAAAALDSAIDWAQKKFFSEDQGN